MEVAGVALAAGSGQRLRPLTDVVPKALCPVANCPLVDHALARLASVGADPVVNVHHHRAPLEEHLAGKARLSIEEHMPLGTAGALGLLRHWLAGRATVVVNADVWCPGSLQPLFDTWDGHRVRVLVPGGGHFGPRAEVMGTLLPWRVVRDLPPEPAGLWETVWRGAAAAGELEVVAHEGPAIDCGTPRRYLEANLVASGGQSVIAEGAEVAGRVERCVVLAGATVRAGERLRDAIRFKRPSGPATILVR